MPLLALPRSAKRLIAVAFDVSICVLTVWLTYYLRLGEFVALSGNALWAVMASVFLSIPIFIVSGLYRAIFRYSGLPALLAVARAVGIYGLLYAAIFTAISLPDVPRTVGIIQPILLLLFIGGSRIFVRFWLGGHYGNILARAARPKVLIYGAGHTGRELAAAIAQSPEMQVAGFLDDDRRLHRNYINGLPVYDPEDLDGLSEKLKISQVLLAMRISRANVAMRSSQGCGHGRFRCGHSQASPIWPKGASPYPRFGSLMLTTFLGATLWHRI